MTLTKIVTFKFNEDKEVFSDIEDLFEGDELFLNKSEKDQFEIFNLNGHSIVTFNNEQELKSYLGYSFHEFENHSFEVRKMNELDSLEGRITLTIKFAVGSIAC